MRLPGRETFQQQVCVRVCACVALVRNAHVAQLRAEAMATNKLSIRIWSMPAKRRRRRRRII